MRWGSKIPPRQGVGAKNSRHFPESVVRNCFSRIFLDGSGLRVVFPLTQSPGSPRGSVRGNTTRKLRKKKDKDDPTPEVFLDRPNAVTMHKQPSAFAPRPSPSGRRLPASSLRLPASGSVRISSGGVGVFREGPNDP